MARGERDLASKGHCPRKTRTATADSRSPPPSTTPPEPLAGRSDVALQSRSDGQGAGCDDGARREVRLSTVIALGVNVVGYLDAVLGQGESARRFCDGLDAVGIPWKGFALRLPVERARTQ